MSIRKSKIINFEWLCDHNHYSYDQFDIIKMKAIENDLRTAADQGYNTIFGIYLIDGFLHCAERPAVFLLEMQRIKEIADELSLEIIIVSGQGEHFPGLPFEHVFFDYTFRMTYCSNREYFDNQIGNNIESDKFLFLGGMPTRANRIGLLSKLYDAKLLEYCEWSFFPPITRDDKQWCRTHLSRYNDEQYDKFITYADRSFDSKYQGVLPYYGGYETIGTEHVWYDIVKTDFIKSPTFVPPGIFGQTSFSIISEGPNFWSEDNFFGTEKSWRTFLYKHPFIFSGHPDQFRYLKQLGYKNFENYMLIQDYAYIIDEDERLNAIVENTRHFVKNISNENIKADVEHNYNLFFQYADQQNKFLKKMQYEFGTDPAEISFFFDRTGYEHLIRKIPDGD